MAACGRRDQHVEGGRRYDGEAKHPDEHTQNINIYQIYRKTQPHHKLHLHYVEIEICASNLT